MLEDVKSSEDEVWEGGNQQDVETNSNDQETKIIEVKEALECYLNSLCSFQVDPTFHTLWEDLSILTGS